MTLVSGPLSTVTTTPSAVAQVNISINSPRTRGAGVMTPEVKTVAVTGGVFSSQIAPGPAVLTLLIGGRESVPIPILVDDVASRTLAEVVNAARLATGETQESLAQFLHLVLGAANDVATAKSAALAEIDGEVQRAIDDSAQTTIDTVVVPAIEGARDEALNEADLAIQAAKDANSVSRVAALEAMGGLSPESPVDGQTASLIAQPDTLTRSAFQGAFDESIPSRLKEDTSDGLKATYVPASMEPINLARYVQADGTDDTAAVNQAAQDAIATGRGLFLPGGLTVTIAGVVNLRHVPVVRAEGTFRVDTAAGGRIDVGHSSSTRGGNVALFKRVQMVDRTHEGVALRLVGAKQADVTVMYCDRLEVYANSADSTTASTAYNRVTLGEIKDLYLTTVGASSWITQTQFMGGDVRKIIIGGDYSPNEITFWDTCLEGSEVRINAGSRVRFMGVRGEDSRGNPSRVWFGERANNCLIEDNHISNLTHTSPAFSVVEDLGFGNEVVTTRDSLQQRQEILAIDADVLMLDKSCELPAIGITPGVVNLLAPANKIVVDTGLIAVGDGADIDVESNGEPVRTEGRFGVRRIFGVSDAKIWRYAVKAYDSSCRVIADSAAIDPGGTLTWSADLLEWRAAIDRYGIRIRVMSPDVAYLRIIVKTSSPARYFQRLRILGVTEGRSSDYLIDRARRSLRRPLYQDTKPTKGLAPLGTVVQGAAGPWQVVGRADTSLASDVVGGETSLTLDSVDGMLAGDVIGVLQPDGGTYWGEVVSVSGSNVTISPALPAVGAQAGVRVSTVRWA